MADEPAKKKLGKTILFIVLAVLAADAVGGVLFYKFAIPRMYKSSQTDSPEEGKKKNEKAKEIGLLAPLEPIVLNPAKSNGEILATEIVLEVRDQSGVEEVKTHEAQIRDSILTYLSFKTVPELNDISKREQFKKDMLDHINSILKSGKVTGIYTKSWIIQFE